MYYTLRATRDRYGFDRTYRANLDNITQVSVDIPVQDDGAFDLDAQRKIAAKYKEVETNQDRIRQLLQEITDARVVLD